MTNRIPLVELIELFEATARPETTLEQEARLEHARAELRHKQHMQIVTFYVMGSLYVLTFCAAFCIATTSHEAELQKWSMSIVTLLAGALVGYLTGKQSK